MILFRTWLIVSFRVLPGCLMLLTMLMFCLFFVCLALCVGVWRGTYSWSAEQQASMPRLQQEFLIELGPPNSHAHSHGGQAV